MKRSEKGILKRRKQQQYATYEQVAAMERQLHQLIEAQRRGNSASSNFLDAITATPAAVDGRITLADCAVAVSVAAGFATTGILAGAGSVLVSGDMSLFPRVLGTFAISGSSLGALRLAGDALNLAGVWESIYEPILDRLIGARPDEDEKDESEPGSAFVLDPGALHPDEWCKLTAKEKCADVVDFATVVHQRQLNKLSIGQKEFRQLRHVLPSGFEIGDKLHGELVEVLEKVGAIRRSGKTWQMIRTPAQVAACVRVLE